MNGAISLPIQLDDSATRDELANLRLQATAIVSALTTISSGLAALSAGMSDVKATGAQTLSSVEQLALYVATMHDATRQQLTQIQADLAVLRDLIPDHKPTFQIHFAVRNKEHS